MEQSMFINHDWKNAGKILRKRKRIETIKRVGIITLSFVGIIIPLI
jgi:hypothetical protein